MSEQSLPPSSMPTSDYQYNPTLITVISGSFRKHLAQIIQLKKELEKHHVHVLSPAGASAINPGEEFVVLDSDPIDNPRLLQDSVFTKIRRSSFLVVANFDGYLGRAAVLEIGYAIANGIAVYCIEPVDDPNLAPYCSCISKFFPELSIENQSHWNRADSSISVDSIPHVDAHRKESSLKGGQ